MKKLFFPLFMCAMMMFAPLPFFVPSAQGADANGAQPSRLMMFFWGIVGYTHWPKGKESLRICLSVDDPHSTLIRQSAREIKTDYSIVIRSMPENVPASCDVLYVSGSGAADRFPRSLIGSPVLTIGDGGGFCSVGGMFCLLPSGGQAGKNINSFAANLDAISRSPLRVNPQVLRLSKRNKGH
ncbi:MAG: YfiR family protein [Azoarcus sp.]|jgi:hypothetical protein|nr:YfiR family protein [Azoarcus sp.]